MAPRRADDGGCGAREIVWRAGDEATSFEVLNTRTQSVSASNFGLGPMTAADWIGDDHSRLVFYTWDTAISGGPPIGPPVPPDDPLPRPAPAFWGSALEVPWGELGATGVREIDLSNHESLSVRSVDIGLCSVGLPWTVTDSTPLPPGVGVLGFDEVGSGVGDQIAQAVLETVDDELSGVIRAELALTANIEAREGWPPHVDIRQRDAIDGLRDEMCMTSYWRLRFQPFQPLGVVYRFLRPASRLCRDYNVAVRFCGRFGARAGQVTFRMTEVDAVVRNKDRRPVCNFQAQRIASTLEDQFRDQLPGEIESTFEDKLTIAGVPGSDLDPGRCGVESIPLETRNARCQEFFQGLNARCEERDGDDQKRCYWEAGVDRVEMMPSRLELVLAEGVGDPIAEFIDGAGSLAPPICRFENEPDSIETNLVETRYLSGAGWGTFEPITTFYP